MVSIIILGLISSFASQFLVTDGMTPEEVMNSPMKHSLADVSDLEAEFSSELTYSNFLSNEAKIIVYNCRTSTKPFIPIYNENGPDRQAPFQMFIEEATITLLFANSEGAQNEDQVKYDYIFQGKGTEIFTVELDSLGNVLSQSSGFDSPKKETHRNEIIPMIRRNDGAEYKAELDTLPHLIPEALFPSRPVNKGFIWEQKNNVDTIYYPAGEIISRLEVINTFIRDEQLIVRIHSRQQYDGYLSLTDKKFGILTNHRVSKLFDVNLDRGMIERESVYTRKYKPAVMPQISKTFTGFVSEELREVELRFIETIQKE